MRPDSKNCDTKWPKFHTENSAQKQTNGAPTEACDKTQNWYTVYLNQTSMCVVRKHVAVCNLASNAQRGKVLPKNTKKKKIREKMKDKTDTISLAAANLWFVYDKKRAQTTLMTARVVRVYDSLHHRHRHAHNSFIYLFLFRALISSIILSSDAHCSPHQRRKRKSENKRNIRMVWTAA